ncbi:hypothetical protein JCM3263A_11470 [Thermobifida fusca]|jgi:hypothetical protein|uniref:Uncharacterized protein n=1 Tax=Thermobifida fusca TM51 TaxID=1169414 RepID=A0A9P2TB97_THEFU|nr:MULTISPECIES: hypothetical protein [Thermobifida]EOR72069.1 hypothetical protein TM51_04223 [Thermobifida fusca TM51]MBO2529336.1 hypothetical protein [Thermobifida sp.]MDD6791638.1 hypothetical protein [Thermobifida fusca]PPS96538.1 hypothetical protein BH05_00820 [Thermobifida fusca]PZN66014.1 MAG: hypothetical protein DIU53_02450 [Thermobifida fusca]
MHFPHPGRYSTPQDNLHEELLRVPFDVAAPWLRVLMIGDPAAAGPYDKLAYSINPELTALLVYRTDPGNYSGVVLDKRHTQAWGRTKQDLWFTALGNMAYDQYQEYTVSSGGDTDVHVVQGIGWAGSAHVMRLSDVMQQPAPYGALVMLPDTNVLAYTVLRSRRSLPAISTLYSVFQQLNEGNAVTDQMLWWRDGRLQGMATRPAGNGGVQVRHSPEFDAVIDRELPA